MADYQPRRRLSSEVRGRRYRSPRRDQPDAPPYPDYSPLWNRPTSATAEAVLGWRFAGLESLGCAATPEPSYPCYNAGENHPHAGSFWRMPERAEPA